MIKTRKSDPASFLFIRFASFWFLFCFASFVAVLAAKMRLVKWCSGRDKIRCRYEPNQLANEHNKHTSTNSVACNVCNRVYPGKLKARHEHNPDCLKHCVVFEPLRGWQGQLGQRREMSRITLGWVAFPLSPRCVLALPALH